MTDEYEKHQQLNQDYMAGKQCGFVPMYQKHGTQDIHCILKVLGPEKDPGYIYTIESQEGQYDLDMCLCRFDRKHISRLHLHN